MTNFEQKVNQWQGKALKELSLINNEETLKEWQDHFLGKKGEISQLTQQIKNLPPKEKPQAGQLINDSKIIIQKELEERKGKIDQQKSELAKNQADWIDLTRPGIEPVSGHLHPITQMRKEAVDIFAKMGFDVFESREVDDDYHVFESLNIPPNHPARDMWDTFWTEDDFVCTTHTSSMQNRILRMKEPPLQAIICGRCFRNEATDCRHEHTFYQIEGICVGEDINLSHLIGTLKTFLSSFYQRDVKLRIQPSYFPFVEPGLEFMIDCAICQGRGEVEGKKCSTCGGSGWLELVPAGMIHPNVLKNAELNPDKYQGFAWGMGLDRLVMIKYGIEDIRHFHQGDLRFLEKF